MICSMVCFQNQNVTEKLLFYLVTSVSYLASVIGQVISDGCRDEDLYEVAKLFFAPRKQRTED